MRLIQILVLFSVVFLCSCGQKPPETKAEYSEQINKKITILKKKGNQKPEFYKELSLLYEGYIDILSKDGEPQDKIDILRKSAAHANKTFHTEKIKEMNAIIKKNGKQNLKFYNDFAALREEYVYLLFDEAKDPSESFELQRPIIDAINTYTICLRSGYNSFYVKKIIKLIKLEAQRNFYMGEVKAWDFRWPEGNGPYLYPQKYCTNDMAIYNYLRIVEACYQESKNAHENSRWILDGYLEICNARPTAMILYRLMKFAEKLEKKDGINLMEISGNYKSVSARLSKFRAALLARENFFNYDFINN